VFVHSRAARIGPAAFSISALVAVAGCTVGAGSESAGTDDLESMEPITLIVSEPLPPASTNNQGTNLFMEYVTEQTDGKVTFEVYDTSTLHPMQEALAAMESGLSDITLYIPGLFPNDVPAGAWATGLAAFTEGTPQEMLAGLPATNAVFTSGPIAEELAARNAVYLGGFTSDSYTPLCTSPLETLADAEGMLARTTGEPYTGEVESLDMVSVLMDANEVYEGLQRGTIDCQVGALQTFINDGLAEIAKSYTPLSFSPNTGPGYIMNKQKYDALPDAVKQIFHEGAALFGIGNDRGLIDLHVEWLTESADEYGLTFVEPSEDLVETLAEYRAAQGATLADQAPDSVGDPQEVIDRFNQVYGDWVQILADEFGLEPNDGSAEASLAAYQFAANEFDWDLYRQRVAEYLAELG
jgi:TRAP-type transport system periplasmic protein